MKKWLSYENIWTRNIFFCLFLFAFLFTQNKFTPEVPGIKTETNAALVRDLFLLYSSFFIHNHYAVRLLLFKKKYGYFTLTSIIFVAIITFVTIILGNEYGIELPVFLEVISSIFTLFLGTAVYFLNYWVLENITKTKVQLLNKEAELDFLKQQLSPHFLFNAINNLYGTALASPEIIPDKILELSDLLRYQVESTTKQQVKIIEEMTFVQNYLNYITYKTNDLKIENETVGVVKSLSLPPLLFLPLLENSVKYSAETENAFIHISWHFEEKSLCFGVENSYLSVDSKINGTKIGLENLEKRLEILNLKYKIIINTDTPNVYKIELKLWELPSNA